VAGRDALGLVCRTGFLTKKGNLVKDILFPKPYVFQFYRDTNKFIILLFVIAIIGFCGVIPGLIKTVPSKIERF
jgi:cation-transporting P-type ATPase 13A2